MGPKAKSETAKPAAKNSAASSESSSSSSSSKRKRENEKEKDVAAGIPTSGRERSHKSSKEVPNGRFYMKWECETSMHREDGFLMSSRYPEPCHLMEWDGTLMFAENKKAKKEREAKGKMANDKNEKKERGKVKVEAAESKEEDDDDDDEDDEDKCVEPIKIGTIHAYKIRMTDNDGESTFEMLDDVSDELSRVGKVLTFLADGEVPTSGYHFDLLNPQPVMKNEVGTGWEISQGECVYVEDIKVDEKFRGLGLGLFMLDQVDKVVNDRMSLLLLMPYPSQYNQSFSDDKPWNAPEYLFDPSKELPPAIAAAKAEHMLGHLLADMSDHRFQADNTRCSSSCIIFSSRTAYGITCSCWFTNQTSNSIRNIWILHQPLYFPLLLFLGVPNTGKNFSLGPRSG